MKLPESADNTEIAQRIGLKTLDETLFYPKFFEIETINACNARCTMCTIEDWEKGKALVMTDALFAKLVADVAEHAGWVDTVCLNRDGEPTLDKKIAPRVKAMKDAGVKKVTFATNGELLTPELTERLLDAGLDDVMISIDGITKETFEKIRVRLTYETVVANALAFLRLRNERKSRTSVRVRMVIVDENKHELARWMDYWKAQIDPVLDRVYAKPAHTWGNQLGHEKETMVARYRERPCVSPFSSMAIQVDGRVPLCAVDYNVKHPMGDFSKQSIKEIWQGDGFRHVRELHASRRRNEIAMCRGCHIWERELMVTEIPAAPESSVVGS